MKIGIELHPEKVGARGYTGFPAPAHGIGKTKISRRRASIIFHSDFDDCFLEMSRRFA
jgi:hypothetical protein